MPQPLRQMAIAAGLLWSRIICALVIAASIFNWGSQMSALQRRIATVSDMTASLIAELRELDRLREQVREALPSVRKSRQPKRNGNGAISRSHWKSADRETSLGRSGPPESTAASHRQAGLG